MFFEIVVSRDGHVRVHDEITGDQAYVIYTDSTYIYCHVYMQLTLLLRHIQIVHVIP
jgi:hypothetical protein